MPGFIASFARFARKKYIVVLTLAGLAVFTLPPAGLAQEENFASAPEYGCGPNRALAPDDPAIKGPDVIELQERLNKLGFGTLKLDGVYGPKTVQAVAEFQRSEGLQSDGVVGKETWEALGEGVLPTAREDEKEKPQGSLSIVVDTQKLRLTLYANGKPYKSYPVAVGRPNHMTLSPIGEWTIVHKSKDWGGGFGTRWLGLNVPWGIYGIHGTNKPWSIGTRASAGCIRMFNRDVEQLFRWVPTGTSVTIAGVKPEVTFNRRLRPGMTGKDVVFVQLRLQESGFDSQGADGRYGSRTARAVEELQRLYGLPVTGEVYDDVYYVLGLK